MPCKFGLYSGFYWIVYSRILWVFFKSFRVCGYFCDSRQSPGWCQVASSDKTNGRCGLTINAFAVLFGSVLCVPPCRHSEFCMVIYRIVWFSKSMGCCYVYKLYMCILVVFPGVPELFFSGHSTLFFL